MDGTTRTGGRKVTYAAIVVAALCAAATLPIWASTVDAEPPAGTKFTADGIGYSVMGTNTGSKEVMVVSAPNVENVILPGTVIYSHNGEPAIQYKVTSIKNDAFQRRADIRTVTIPSNVNFIGTGTFSGSKAIESITVDPRNVKFSSENGVLFNAERTNLIYYPPAKPDISYAVPNGVTIISANAFKDAALLKSVGIAGTVGLMGSNAFYGCKALESVVLPSSVTSMGENTFQGCTSLKTATLSPSMLQITSNGFRGCTSLTSMTIPEGVTSIGTYAFFGCTSLERIDIPASTSYIGANAFKGCTSLSFIDVDVANVKYDDIDGVLFNEDHSKLIMYPEGRDDHHYDIPYSVTEINKEAFMDRELRVVTIHGGVTAIASNAVQGDTLKIHYQGVSVLYAQNKGDAACIAMPNDTVTSMTIGTFEGGNDIQYTATDKGWTFPIPEGTSSVYVQAVVEEEPVNEERSSDSSSRLYEVAIGIAIAAILCAVIVYVKRA